MQRATRTLDAGKLKSDWGKDGRRMECAACFWAPPALYHSILNLHHIVPVQAGGSDEEANLLLLCPNCHALAHAMFPVRGHQYRGPRERVILLVALREPEVYTAFKKRQAVRSIDRSTVPPDPPKAAPAPKPIDPTPLDSGLLRYVAQSQEG